MRQEPVQALVAQSVRDTAAHIRHAAARRGASVKREEVEEVDTPPPVWRPDRARPKAPSVGSLGSSVRQLPSVGAQEGD